MDKKAYDMKKAKIVLRYGATFEKEGYFPVLKGYVDDSRRGFTLEKPMWSSPILKINYVTEDFGYDAFVETDNSFYRVEWDPTGMECI